MSDMSHDARVSEGLRVESLRALELPRGARFTEIRAAYIRLAREMHPDLHPDDPTRAMRFRDIAAAYEILRRYHRWLKVSPAHTIKSRDLDKRWVDAFGHLI